MKKIAIEEMPRLCAELLKYQSSGDITGSLAEKVAILRAESSSEDAFIVGILSDEVTEYALGMVAAMYWIASSPPSTEAEVAEV